MQYVTLITKVIVGLGGTSIREFYSIKAVDNYCVSVAEKEKKIDCPKCGAG